MKFVIKHQSARDNVIEAVVFSHSRVSVKVLGRLVAST
jgi:hypothetical protein